MFGGPIKVLAEKPFVESKTKVSGLRIEHRFDEAKSRVQFHIWPEQEGESFPEGMEELFRSSFSTFPDQDIIVEYIPEVKSWYAEVKNLRMGFSEPLIETLLSKVAKRANG